MTALKVKDSAFFATVSEELLSTLLSHLDAMVAYWDNDQTCVFANAAYSEWFGKDPSKIVGTTLRNLLGPLYQQNLPYIKAAYAGQKQVFERAIPYRTVDSATV
jgi:PAS domain S-box-containing protein